MNQESSKWEHKIKARNFKITQQQPSRGSGRTTRSTEWQEGGKGKNFKYRATSRQVRSNKSELPEKGKKEEYCKEEQQAGRNGRKQS